MKVKVDGREFIVTDMIVIDSKVNSHMKYNVFDEKYNRIVTIDCEDDIEFMKKFNDWLKENG